MNGIQSAEMKSTKMLAQLQMLWYQFHCSSKTQKGDSLMMAYDWLGQKSDV